MKDKLSYSQLYNELETLNTSACDCFLGGDFDAFQTTIDDFINSGIMEQEEFALAREAYRYSSMPFTLDGIWVGINARNPLDKPVTDFSGWPIQELNKRDVLPAYAYLAEQTTLPSDVRDMTLNRTEMIDQYRTLYQNLYKDTASQNMFSFPLVNDPDNHKMVYVNRVTELAVMRSKCYTTFDFTTLNMNDIKFIDTEGLRNMTLPEKINYLTKSFDNIYDHKINKNRYTIKDCFAFNGYHKVLASNYLQGKRIDRKNWKRYTAGKLPANPLFFLQLAFYLTIPSSDEIERFMNLHGYSIKSPMTLFQSISCGKQEYHILHRDLCRWIDAGIDYNLLNEMCGYELEVKEVRKPKL